MDALSYLAPFDTDYMKNILLYFTKNCKKMSKTVYVIVGRDENVKMDVDSVDSVDGRRPMSTIKTSVVDVDQENVRMVDVDQ